mmetsp:Transcript_8289/g.12330  ORF Transcript_8289/g.12330 Transcript_8289/m.12330 type:complete len:80 (-) Transcript_8289:138-377(-)
MEALSTFILTSIHGSVVHSTVLIKILPVVYCQKRKYELNSPVHKGNASLCGEPDFCIAVAAFVANGSWRFLCVECGLLK